MELDQSIDFMSFLLNIYSVKIFCSITPALEQFTLSYPFLHLHFIVRLLEKGSQASQNEIVD